MKPIIFTLVGIDKPGLISDLAKTVYDMGGNWLGSNFSHMAGHFMPCSKNWVCYARMPSVPVHEQYCL